MHMLEAGELFEGIADFSVPAILEQMGLSGAETAKDLGVSVSPRGVDGRSERVRVEVDNTTPLSEGDDREVGEAGFETPEA